MEIGIDMQCGPTDAYVLIQIMYLTLHNNHALSGKMAVNNSRILRFGCKGCCLSVFVKKLYLCRKII